MNKNIVRHTLVILYILIAGIVLNYRYMDEPPLYMHSWAQSDRYALALGFINNDFNLLYPETYVLNPQFPGKVDYVWSYSHRIPYDNGITSVDCPMHDYIVALIMKITGSRSIAIFRWYTLLYSFLGLFFLYKLAFLLTKNFPKSLLILVVMSTAPVFVYYQCSTLPSIPSFANAVIGLYLYLYYLSGKKIRYFHLGILFFTLAALNRTTFVIPLIAVCCFEVIRVWRKETTFPAKLYSIVPSMMVIFAYFLWNHHLRLEYGSIFLGQLLIPGNRQEMIEILKLVYERGISNYFSHIHYWIFLFVVAGTIAGIIWRSVKYSREEPPKRTTSLWLLSGGWLLGTMIFFYVMMIQFPDHNYYFIDTFYLPLMFSLVLLLRYIPDTVDWRINLPLVLLIFCLSSPLIISAGKGSREQRWLNKETPAYCFYDFNDSGQLMESLDIPGDAVLFVYDGYPQNYPLSLMDRKGFVFMFLDDKVVDYSLEWDYDYLVFQNSFFVENYSRYPAQFSRYRKVADNGKISVAVLADTAVVRSPEEFLNLDQKKIRIREVMRNDTVSSSFTISELSSARSFSGGRSGYMTAGKYSGFEYDITDLDLLREKEHTLYFSGRFLKEGSVDEVLFILSIESPAGRKIYYKYYTIGNDHLGENDWKKIDALFQIPRLPDDPYHFSLQVLPVDINGAIYYDDIEILIY